MCSLRKRIQRLFQRLPRRRQVRLGLRVLSVAVNIQFVAACAEQRRRQRACDGRNEAGGEVGSRLGRETELPSWGLIGKVLPWGSLRASNVFGVGSRNYGCVAWSIDFLV